MELQAIAPRAVADDLDRIGCGVGRTDAHRQAVDAAEAAQGHAGTIGAAGAVLGDAFDVDSAGAAVDVDGAVGTHTPGRSAGRCGRARFALDADVAAGGVEADRAA